MASAGWVLPAPPRPAGDYHPASVGAGLVVTAGQLPRVDGVLAYKGRIGVELSVADARAAAEVATLNALAAMELATGGLDHVRAVLHLRGFLRAVDDFEHHAHVMDAASAVLSAAFPGRHARTAVGVASLPGGAPVEIELLAELAGN
nr:RidA family protein [Kribbella solani]